MRQVNTKRLQLNQIQLKWLREHNGCRHMAAKLMRLRFSVLTEFPSARFAQWSQVRGRNYVKSVFTRF